MMKGHTGVIRLRTCCGSTPPGPWQIRIRCEHRLRVSESFFHAAFQPLERGAAHSVKENGVFCLVGQIGLMNFFILSPPWSLVVTLIIVVDNSSPLQ
jgi:hypothetical protein